MNRLATKKQTRILEKTQTDFEWFLKATEEQEIFKGKFVAIHNGKIIASGDTFKDALDSGRAKISGKMPLISFIPREEALEV